MPTVENENSITESILNLLPESFSFVLLILVVIFSWLVIQTIVEQIGKIAQQRQQDDFKRELLDRGLEADEVKTILEAAPLENDAE